MSLPGMKLFNGFLSHLKWIWNPWHVLQAELYHLPKFICWSSNLPWVVWVVVSLRRYLRWRVEPWSDRASLAAHTVKNLPAMQETWVWSLGRKIPWIRKWQPTSVFLPGKSNGWRSLVGYTPWRWEESGMTGWLTHTWSDSTNVLYKKRKGYQSSLLTTWGHSQKATVCKPVREFTQILLMLASTLILDFHPEELWENKFLLLRPPSLL